MIYVNGAGDNKILVEFAEGAISKYKEIAESEGRSLRFFVKDAIEYYYDKLIVARGL